MTAHPDNDRHAATGAAPASGSLLAWLLATAAVSAALYPVSRQNYLLFHGLIEVLSAAVGFAVLLVVWSTRRLAREDALVVLAVGFVCAGVLDILHFLSYKGMGVFAPEVEANTATQLWIAGSLLRAAAFVGFAASIGRRGSLPPLLATYATLTAVLIAAIVTHRAFPVCYIEGMGLTPFKRASEYAISLALAAGAFMLYRKRARLEPTVVRFVLAAQITCIGSGLTFTLYTDVYGLLNFLGHDVKLAGTILTYAALIRAGLAHPLTLLSRDLADERERLREKADQYESILATTEDGFWVIDGSGRLVEVNDRYSQMSGHAREELLRLTASDLSGISTPEHFAQATETAWREGVVRFESRHRRRDGSDFDVEMSISPWRSKGRSIVFIRDLSERRQAESALTKSQAVYQAMFEGSTAVSMLIDPATGAIVDANAAACSFYGYPRDRLITLCIWDINVLGESEVRQRMQAATQLAETHFEFRHRLASGEIRDVNVYTSPIVRGNCALLYSIVIDVTAGVMAERSLRDQLERFDLVLAGINGAVWDWDIVRQSVFYSPQWKHLHGYANDEITDSEDWWRTAIHHDDRNRVEANLAQHIAAKRTSAFAEEYRIICKDGSIKWILDRGLVVTDESGRPIRMAGSETEITAQKRSEEALHLSQERFSNAFEYAPIGMALVSPEGQWLRVNQSLSHSLGYTEQELLARSTFDLLHPDDLPTSRELSRRLLAGEIQTYQVEHRYIHKSGRPVWAMLSASLVRNQNRSPLYFIAQVQDVSTQHEAELRNRLSLDILHILSQDADLPLLTSRVVHALRQTLSIDAAAIRLSTDQDFCYYAHTGFSEAFVESEDHLCARGVDGSLEVGPDGRPRLECTCGLVLEGRTDPANPLFSPGGSAWTNDARPFADAPREGDHRLNPRNLCIREGFVSIALIPIRSGLRILGLLQLNHRQANRFTPDLIAFLEGLASSVGLVIAQRQAAQEQRDTLDRLELAHDAAKAGTWEWHLQTNVNIWSPSLWPLYGLDPRTDEPSYAAWRKAIHPDDRAQTERRVLEAARDGTELSAEWRVCKPDGSVRWLMSRGRPICNSSGQVIRYVGIVLDIDNLKRTEQCLRESEDRFHQAFARCPALLTLIDIGTWKIREVNDVWCETFRHSREAAIGKTPVELGLFDEQAFSGIMEAVRLQPSGQHHETQVNTRDGHSFTLLVSRDVVNIQGQPTLLVMGMNITDLRRAEARVIELTTAIEQASDGVAITDIRGTMSYVNAAWAAMHGRTTDSLIGQHLTVNHTPEQVRLDVLPHLEQLTALGHYAGEVAHVRADGTSFVTWMSTSVLKGEGRRPIGWVAIAQDTTERKRLEDMRTRLATQLAQAQKMESLGCLAGGVAHDFNNYMYCVLGFCEIIDEMLDAASPLRPHVDQIRLAAQQAADVTQQLLAFSRKQVIQPVPTDIDQLIRSQSKMLHRLIGEDVEIGLDLQTEGTRATVDPSQLQQVIVNLCVNARDAMPDGGKITIDSRVVRASPPGGGREAPATERLYTRISVTDTGTGIPPTLLARIFEPFFTTKPSGRGTGLGLAVVQGIVQQHAGWIDVSSVPGQGTRFEVNIPCHANATIARQAKAVATQCGSGQLILLVEDSPVVRKVATLRLESIGYRVITAGSVEAGWQEFRAATEPIAVLLSDVVLPDGTGVDLAHRVEVSDPSVIIILSSGYADEKSRVHEIKNHRWSFLAKPYSKQVMAALLHRLLAERRG